MSVDAPLILERSFIMSSSGCCKPLTVASRLLISDDICACLMILLSKRGSSTVVSSGISGKLQLISSSSMTYMSLGCVQMANKTDNALTEDRPER